MKVKTDYVPKESSHYLSPGKEYEVVSGDGDGGEIIDDNGGRVFVYFQNSTHLNERPWQIIDEVDTESPITTECDALREENEMLAAENRRLLNEIAELQKYPEVAVRAVFDYSLDLGNEAGHDGEVFLSDAFDRYAEEVALIFTEALQKGE